MKNLYKKKTVLDFDGTLFDQSKFLPMYYRFLSENYHIPLEIVEESYESTRVNTDFYDWKVHIKNLGGDVIAFLDIIDAYFQDLEQYLYDDVIDSISSCSSLIILTAGESTFQKWKVESSLKGIDFKLVTPGVSKHSYLLGLDKNDVFVDNRVEYFSNEYECKQFRILRKGDKYRFADRTPDYVNEVDTVRGICDINENSERN